MRTDIKVTTGRDVVWSELPRCNHLLHIYDDDAGFLDHVQAFIEEGLSADESVIVIATASHRKALEHRLAYTGTDIGTAAREGRYIALSAQETLEEFMVRGSPDEERFNETIMGVIERARAGGRNVRAFGEMVALLWARGNHAGTVRLEYLWNKLLCSQHFPLFCAYPSRTFHSEVSPSVETICAAHTRVVGGEA